MSKTPEILTLEESERMLNAIQYPKGPKNLRPNSFRNYLMALFMLDAGLRVSEVIQLKRYLLHWVKNPVNTLELPADIAKNHRPRQIPMSDRLKAGISFLMDNVWINTTESNIFYVFHTGNPRKHITARTVQRVICSAGLTTCGRRVWPHVLRHTFATRLMRVTSTRVVQELLGHKNLSSTQVYTHPNSQDLLNAIEEM